jgi:hypothetical protein
LKLGSFLRAVGTQAIILIFVSILLWFLAGYIRVDSLIELALVAGTFCLISWVAQYFLVLEARHRAVFPAIGQLMGLAPKSN